MAEVRTRRRRAQPLVRQVGVGHEDEEEGVGAEGRGEEDDRGGRQTRGLAELDVEDD